MEPKTLEIMERMEKNLNSIPEECELTLEHVLTHLNCAQESEENGDKGQLTHDLDMASRILMAMVYKMDLAAGRYN